MYVWVIYPADFGRYMRNFIGLKVVFCIKKWMKKLQKECLLTMLDVFFAGLFGFSVRLGGSIQKFKSTASVCVFVITCVKSSQHVGFMQSS